MSVEKDIAEGKPVSMINDGFEQRLNEAQKRGKEIELAQARMMKELNEKMTNST
jgi:hypothetical protein